jgi:hypothetical protein
VEGVSAAMAQTIQVHFSEDKSADLPSITVRLRDVAPDAHQEPTAYLLALGALAAL